VIISVARLMSIGKGYLINILMVTGLLSILQNKFRRKYEQALSKCWMICVPCSRALRGIEITEDFVGM
jgi:hypothetical protein